MTSKKFRGDAEEGRGRGRGGKYGQLHDILKTKTNSHNFERRERSETRRFSDQLDIVTDELVVCENCQFPQPDVFQFLVENNGYGSRINHMVRQDLCVTCVDSLSDSGLEVRAIHSSVALTPATIKIEIAENIRAKMRHDLGETGVNTPSVNALLRQKLSGR